MSTSMSTDWLACVFLLCMHAIATVCLCYLHYNNLQGIGSDYPFVVKKSRRWCTLLLGWNVTFILPCHASLSCVEPSVFSQVDTYVPCNRSSCTWRTSFHLCILYICVYIVASYIAKLDMYYSYNNLYSSY